VASTGCVSVKFDIEDFYESLLRKSKFGQNGMEILGNVHGYL
jgi:hypothetical protein